MSLLSSPPPSTPQPDAKKISTLAAHIYKEIFQKIVAGEYAPGQRLEEKVLAAHFNVSRTPIREALRELAAQHMVELARPRGVQVTSVVLDRLVDMMEGECEIDGLCARLASQRMTTMERTQLANLHERTAALIEQGTLNAYFELNAEFHELISAGAHNLTLAAMARDLRSRLSPFRRPQSESDTQKMLRSHHEHERVIEAVVGGDAEGAYAAMRNHNARVNADVVTLLHAAPVTDRKPPDPRRAVPAPSKTSPSKTLPSKSRASKTRASKTRA